jgi:hypothetical protein
MEDIQNTFMSGLKGIMNVRQVVDVNVKYEIVVFDLEKKKKIVK